MISGLRAIGSISITALMCLLSMSASSCMPPRPTYEGYEYLVIAPEEAMQEVETLAEYKASQGFLVEEVTLEEILAGNPGEDGPEEVRNYLTRFATLTPEREFVLLVGSVDVMPMRMAYPDASDHSESARVPTDFYYEALDATWDADGDGFFGEYGDDMTPETEDYDAKLHVGRIPWDGPEEIRAICDAIVRYEEDRSARMTRALLGAATIVEPCDTSILLSLADAFVFSPLGYDTMRLCEDCPAANPDFELTQYSFVEQWEAVEPGFVFVFSHGAPSAAVLGDKKTPFLSTDLIPQGVEPGVITSTACSIGSPDSPSPSLGRVLVREGVCAAALVASRITWYGTDPWPVLFAGVQLVTTLVAEKRCVGEAKRRFVDDYSESERIPENLTGWRFHQNLFLLTLYGDPSLQLAGR